MGKGTRVCLGKVKMWWCASRTAEPRREPARRPEHADDPRAGGAAVRVAAAVVAAAEYPEHSLQGKIARGARTDALEALRNGLIAAPLVPSDLWNKNI